MEEKNTEIFTSFGLFFAVATPVKPKKKKKKRLQKHFSADDFHKKKTQRTQTPKQCRGGTHLAHLQLLPPPCASLFGSPARVSGRSRGGGVSSAIYLHHCRGQRSPRLVQRKIGSSPRANPAPARPRLSEEITHRE